MAQVLLCQSALTVPVVNWLFVRNKEVQDGKQYAKNTHTTHKSNTSFPYRYGWSANRECVMGEYTKYTTE